MTRIELERRRLREAVERLRGAHRPLELGRALRELGELERHGADADAARACYEESVALLRGAGDPLRLAHTVRHLGDLHFEAGRTGQAGTCYDEALAIYRAEAGAGRLDRANAVRGLAVLKTELDEREPATRLWQEAHDLYAETGVDAGVAESAARLALLAWQAGEVPRAREWLRRASAAARACPDPDTARFVEEVASRIGPA